MRKPRLSLPTLLEELADGEEAGMGRGPAIRIPGGRYTKLLHRYCGRAGTREESIMALLETEGWKARELALFELRLEARGKPAALRATAADHRSFLQRRETLIQSLIYPIFLSLFLGAALTALQLVLNSGSFSVGPAATEPPVSPLHLSLLTFSTLLPVALLPTAVLLLTRRREIPGRGELLVLLRESLLLSPSFGSSLRRLRRVLSIRGLRWKPLELVEGRLQEGESLPAALEPLRPPLTGDDLALLGTHPERKAAAALLGSLIRYLELRARRRDERQKQLLPALALVLVGLELLIVALAVVLPLMEGLLFLSLT